LLSSSKFERTSCHVSLSSYFFACPSKKPRNNQTANILLLVRLTCFKMCTLCPKMWRGLDFRWPTTYNFDYTLYL
jgi:hypothetical protein